MAEKYLIAKDAKIEKLASEILKVAKGHSYYQVKKAIYLALEKVESVANIS